MGGGNWRRKKRKYLVTSLQKMRNVGLFDTRRPKIFFSKKITQILRYFIPLSRNYEIFGKHFRNVAIRAKTRCVTSENFFDITFSDKNCTLLDFPLQLRIVKVIRMFWSRKQNTACQSSRHRLIVPVEKIYWTCTLVFADWSNQWSRSTKQERVGI